MKGTFDRSSISVIMEYVTLFSDIYRSIKFRCLLTGSQYIDYTTNVKLFILKFMLEIYQENDKVYH